MGSPRNPVLSFFHSPDPTLDMSSAGLNMTANATSIVDPFLTSMFFLISLLSADKPNFLDRSHRKCPKGACLIWSDTYCHPISLHDAMK